MTVDLFGDTTSPRSANFALKKVAGPVAGDSEDQCGTEAADLARNNFYVEGLRSASTLQEAES